MAGRKKGTRNKSHEFEIFSAWYLLSPILRLRSEAELDTMGVIDEDVRELLKIRTGTDFRNKYKISPTTLAKWNAEMAEVSWKTKFSWLRRLSTNVMVAMYRKVLVEGDAPRVMSWMKLVEGYQETTQQTSDPELLEQMRQTTEFFKILANKP